MNRQELLYAIRGNKELIKMLKLQVRQLEFEIKELKKDRMQADHPYWKMRNNLIYNLYKQGEHQKDIAAQFEIDHTVVAKICREQDYYS